MHTEEPITKRSRNRTVIRKHIGELFAEPPAPKVIEEGRKKKKNGSKKTATKETSSDSESMTSSTSEEPTQAPQVVEKVNKNIGKKKAKKMAPPRRSSFEFEPLPKFLKKRDQKDNTQEDTSSQRSRRGKSLRTNAVATSTIVCTSCHRDDINLVKQLVKMFGVFTFSTSVTSNTSHVVSGEGKRTLNLLKGLLQGCWIVTKVILEKN